MKTHIPIINARKCTQICFAKWKLKMNKNYDTQRVNNKTRLWSDLLLSKHSTVACDRFECQNIVPKSVTRQNTNTNFKWNELKEKSPPTAQSLALRWGCVLFCKEMSILFYDSIGSQVKSIQKKKHRVLFSSRINGDFLLLHLNSGFVAVYSLFFPKKFDIFHDS